jgi:hypothetical protein
VGDEKVLKAAVMRYLEAMEKSDPTWKLHLGTESLSATQLRERINTDPKLWKEIRQWADALAVDMFNEGRKKIESNTGTP